MLRELATQVGQERLPAGLFPMRNIIVGQVKGVSGGNNLGRGCGGKGENSHGELEEVKEVREKKELKSVCWI